jgi:hypothetical protein
VLGQSDTGGPRPGQPLGTGPRVRVARVDHQSTDLRIGGEMFAADLYRRCAKAVAREHARNAGTGIQQDDRQILAPHLANACFGRAQANTSYGMKVRRSGRGQIDWHGVIS